MIDPNQATLAAYEGHVADYIATTPHELSGSLRSWIESLIARLETGAQVLEIGSGFGRDADYLESRGLSVVRSDAAQGFVDYLREHGKPAWTLNVLTDEIGGPWAMIFADAVFLHFSPAQAALAFQKARGALRPQGLLAFSVKRGRCGSRV